MIDLTHISLETTAAEVAYRHRRSSEPEGRYTVRPRGWSWGRRRHTTGK